MSTAKRAQAMQGQNRITRVRRQAGLSLVEVFVALLVLSVGLIALAKLQVDLVRGGGDARTRAAALALAEQKIEDLRTFTEMTSSADWSVVAGDATKPMAWSFIGNNTGGRIKSGTVQQAGVLYNLSWTSDNKTTVGPDNAESLYKNIDVTVSWTAVGRTDGDNQPPPVVLSASIPDTPPGLTALASTDLIGNQTGPTVTHIEGTRPEVVSIDVGGGLRRETSRPLPTVKKTADSTMVSFDVVTYHTNYNNAVARREEFVTLSCKCTFDGTGLARTPAKVALVGSTLLRDQPGKLVNKTVGKPADTQQPPLCNICCRDHHDYTDGTTHYRYNPEATADHQHYLKTNLNSPVTSGDYDEACRLKRINGVWQVFEDWQLRTLTVMPKSDLLEGAAKATEYQTAVKIFVSSYAAAKAGSGTMPTSLSFTPSSVAINPGTSQLLARAIYVDSMPQSVVDRISAILSDDSSANDATVRALVPFYEVHLTKLADWSAYPNINSAMVSSEGVETDTQALADIEPYSRGFVHPAASPAAGNVTMIASAKSHNTGVTGTAAVNPDEGKHPVTAVTIGNGASATTYYYSNTLPSAEVAPATAQHKDGTLTVQVAANGPTITISGTMNKADGSGDIDKTKISIPTVTGGSCTATSAGQGLESFTCTVSPGVSGWTGSIQFSSTASPAYVFCLANDGQNFKKGSGKDPDVPARQCTAMSNGIWTPTAPVVPLTGNYTLPIWVSTPVP
jgi:type IV pilus modification protein PilV